MCECRASERRYDRCGGEGIVTGGDATRLDGAFCKFRWIGDGQRGAGPHLIIGV